jgi:hypothetical protein
MDLKFGEVLRIEHEENLVGKDYIVGDLHGSVHLLEKFMKEVSFDKEKDRMFSVGDLVDRGIDSFGTLKLIREKWFFPVLGNHEQMFYSYVKNNPDGYGYSFLNNGGDWIQRYAHTDDMMEIRDLADELISLPRVRTIKGKNKIHIVHAEFNVTNGIGLTDENIENDETLNQLCRIARSDGEDFSFWGRSLFYDFYGTDPKTCKVSKEKFDRYNSDDLSLIVSGHTIMNTPVKIGKCLNIDTGAFNKYRSLTIYSVKSKDLFSINFEDVTQQIEPFVVIPTEGNKS